MILNYIIWDNSPNITTINDFPVKWYGLLFASSYLFMGPLLKYMFKKEGKPPADVDILLVYIMCGVGMGARLGHVLFYDLDYYIDHPLEAILPITFNPKFQFIGFQGLASHGAAIGIIIAIFLYLYRINLRPFKIKSKGRQDMLCLLDKIVIVVAFAGAMIRIGNFMNSEIIGKPTGSNYGVVFARSLKENLTATASAIESVQLQKRKQQGASSNHLGTPIEIVIHFKNYGLEEEQVKNFLERNMKDFLAREAINAAVPHIKEQSDQPLKYTLAKSRQGGYIATITTTGIPRHPAQLYEAFSCILLFLLLYLWWCKKRSTIKNGQVFALFLVILFSLRFFYEHFKENQSPFENDMTWNMGQLLSIPWVVLGVVLLCYRGRRR